MLLDPDVSVEVLHPDPLDYYSHNNANSLVIRLGIAGRTLLLMGDVELTGFAHLRKRAKGAADVFQAPHHGSSTANTRKLATWASPSVVIVSGGFVSGRMEELEKLYGSQVRLLSTFEEGAITIEITPEGHVLTDSIR